MNILHHRCGLIGWMYSRTGSGGRLGDLHSGLQMAGREGQWQHGPPQLRLRSQRHCLKRWRQSFPPGSSCQREAAQWFHWHSRHPTARPRDAVSCPAGLRNSNWVYAMVGSAAQHLTGWPSISPTVGTSLQEWSRALARRSEIPQNRKAVQVLYQYIHPSIHPSKI